MKERLIPVLIFAVFFIPSIAGGWQIAAAQDVTPEPVATEVVVVPPAPTAEATVEPPVVVVNPPATQDNSLASLLLGKLFDGALILAVIMLAFRQGKLIDPQTADNAMTSMFGLIKELTAKTPTKVDDELVDIAEPVTRQWVQDQLKKHAEEVAASLNRVVSSSPN